MQVEKKALYNSLRLNWLRDTSFEVEPWQVEDYRLLSSDELFARLSKFDISLDRDTLVAYADNFSSPEDLAPYLANDDLPARLADQIYLVSFELWRRFLPQKQSLSIFCDELDYQIHQYDEGLIDADSLQDVISYLEEVLEENSGEDADPSEVFESIAVCCAHDVEGFIYDFIAGQIDEENHLYATELYESFQEYIGDTVWFDFLRARLNVLADVSEANDIIMEIIEDQNEGKDLELYLEILPFLVQHGKWEVFISVLKACFPHLEVEEDFREVLDHCVDFYTLRDNEEFGRPIQEILDKRESMDPEKPVSMSDPDIALLAKQLEQPFFLPRNS